MAFRFRQFTVEDKQSTLRVGTDAMLLGSWANPGRARKILDIGTGCGVLALMMAQKSRALIDAIDIDKPSVVEAQDNFSKSPWSSRIRAFHGSLQNFSCSSTSGYGFIITNPPYFSNSLKSHSIRANQARHDEHLTLRQLGDQVSRLLSPAGRFAFILPPVQAEMFQMICTGNGLFPSRRMIIFPKPDKPANRILAEFSAKPAQDVYTSDLTILDSSGKYTSEYLALTAGFHNF